MIKKYKSGTHLLITFIFVLLFCTVNGNKLGTLEIIELFFLSLIISVVYVILKIAWNNMFPKIISASYNNGIMTVTYDNNSFECFQGESTVWHKLPLMQRCSTTQELMLSELYAYNKTHGGAFPTAHLKTK